MAPRFPPNLPAVLQRPLNVHALPDEILQGLSVRASSIVATSPATAAGQDGNDSASSSSDSDSDSDSDDDNKIREESAARSDADDEEDASAAYLAARFALRSPLIQFTPSPALAPDVQLSVYRALFPSSLDRPEAFLPYLRELQLTADDLVPGERERRWVLLMLAGGHFAGCVVALGGKREGKKAVKGQDGELRVLKHKTFHRYTTRRKQGGSQSKNDNAKGAANSIGAQMRRAGEAKLNDEVRELLESWQDDFNAAERIFIRGSVSAKKTFWGYDGAVVTKDDERIKTFPFPTRRPALAELIRCYHELTRAKLSFYTAEQLHEAETAYLASIAPRPTPTAAPAPAAPAPAPKPKLSDDEERLRERWRRLLEMVRKGKVDALVAFWDKWDGSAGMALGGRGELPAWLVDEDGSRREATLLMAAVVAGQEAVVRWLLEEKRADPTVPVPSGSGPSTAAAAEGDAADGTDGADGDGEGDACPPSTFRTAYDLAATKPVRSVFRRLAFDHPDWWTWTSTAPGGARVPSGLSAEQEEQQKQKGGERRKGLKDKMKARRAAAPSPTPTPAEAEAPAAAVGAVTAALQAAQLKGPQRLGGQGTAVDLGQSLQGLTAEMRQRIERERRARAAEARMSGR